MRILALCSTAALSLAFAANANATIVGSTYTFSTSEAGNTVIIPLTGPTVRTDPFNPAFCVGSTTLAPNCFNNSGLFGAYTFAKVSPTLDTIQFNFFGSTIGAGPGSFNVDLGNFNTVDGEVVTAVTYASGNLIEGNFTSVSFDGTTAIFTGTTSTDYNAPGGKSVIFNVTTKLVPAPLIGHGLLVFLAVGGLLFGGKFWERSNNPRPLELAIPQASA